MEFRCYFLSQAECSDIVFNVTCEDVKEKQITKPFVKEWLGELQDEIYQAKDVFDKEKIYMATTYYIINLI